MFTLQSIPDVCRVDADDKLDVELYKCIDSNKLLRNEVSYELEAAMDCNILPVGGCDRDETLSSTPPHRIKFSISLIRACNISSWDCKLCINSFDVRLVDESRLSSGLVSGIPLKEAPLADDDLGKYLIGNLLSPFRKRNDPPRPEFDRVIPLFGKLSILSTSCSCVLVRLGGESLSLSSSSRGAFSNTFLRLPLKLPPLAELFLGSLLAGRRRFSSIKGK